MPGIDDRILRRNLASDRPIGSFNLNSGVNKSFFNGLHPNRNLMGNLSTSSLHRSMPSVNEQKINKEEEEKQKINNNNNNFRHLSLCYENKQNNKIINEENKKEINYNKNEKIRCASAHSFNSLTQNNSTNNIFTSNFCEQINSTPALDTKHIEFFLKKREDSQTTITTTLSDEIDILNNNSSQLKQQQQSIDILPQSSSSSTINNLNNNLIKLKSQKLFKSSDTRSSIFSVSSSLDSTKEEKIISNLEHLPNKIVILPRPNFSKTFQENNLNELKKEENNNNKIIELLNSSENQNIGLISPITHRRPSIDSNKNNLLSSWHSVSDFQNINKIIINNKNKTTLEINNKLNNNNNEIWRSPPIIRPQTQSGIRRSNYLGAIVWQVDETVYCGGIEAALNQNLLCRLNIEYIVDLSGQEDDPTFTNTRPRSEYPCLCPKRTAHSRMTMSIKIKDDSQQQMLTKDTRQPLMETKAQLLEREEIIHYFETLIDLIRKARISQKKVLIHSLRGRNRAPAFVAAYLMHCNKVTRVRAINKITKMMSSNRPGICISDTLQKALMRWQSMLGIRAESSRLDSQQLNKLFEVKKTAWN